jgi:MFS transporter, DHA1 family, tetracycline resistance protein
VRSESARRASQDGSPSAKRRAPQGYFTIWSTVALDLIGFGIVVPILALYAERYGASPKQIGLLLASYSLAQFAAAPLLGRLSDRIGRKPVIVISLVGTAVGSFVTGAAGSLWVLFLGRVLDGASGGSLSVAQAAVADIAEPGERERLLGMLGAAFGVGFVIGPAIGGLAALGGPHVPFYVAGVLASVNAVAAIVRLPETRRPDGGLHASAEPAAERAPRALILRRWAAIGFVATLSFVGFEATFSLFARRRFSLGEAGVSVVFLCIGVVLVAMQGGAYGRLAARHGARSLFVAGLATVAAGLAVMSFARNWPALVVALALLTVGQGCLSPSITSLVAEAAPAAQRGQAMGFQQSANALARVVGPVLATALFQDIGVWMPFVVGAALCVAALAMSAVWRITRRESTYAA